MKASKSEKGRLSLRRDKDTREERQHSSCEVKTDSTKQKASMRDNSTAKSLESFSKEWTQSKKKVRATVM